MPAGATVVMLILIAGLAITGWFCIYKTDVLVRRARRQYEKYTIVRIPPLSSMVTKDWYPTYLRFFGVLVWIWDIVLIYLVWFHKPR